VLGLGRRRLREQLRPRSAGASRDRGARRPRRRAASPALTTTGEGPFYSPDPGGRATPILRGDAPNVRYARLDAAECENELRRREIAFVAAEATPGVLAPVRLRGPLHAGVSIHSVLPPPARARAAMEIFDCRLVLALDDFAGLLAAHDIVEMTHLSAFRSRAAHGCTPKYAGKQHCAALAVDVRSFAKKDGSVLSVERDFHGRVGQSTCADGSRPNPETPAAKELWGLVCDAAARGIFHVILTPNFNAQHYNHMHLEITPDAGWMLVR
jgi:hypothetical protein